MGEKGKIVKEFGTALKQGALQGIRQKAFEKGSGGGDSGGSGGGVSSGGGDSGPNVTKVVFWIIFLLVIGVCIWLAFLDKSGFLENRMGIKLDKPIEVVRDSVSAIGRQLSKTTRIISGEEVGFYSLQEDFKESKKTGLELDEIKVRSGLVENNLYVGGDLKFGSSIEVNEFPENLEKLEKVNVECYMDDIKGKVLVSGKAVQIVDIINPKMGGLEDLDIGCLIPEKEIKLPQVYNKKTLRFDLKYSREGDSAEYITLDVFIIPDEEIYIKYEGKQNKAFEELASGEFKKYYNPIVSEMMYKSDVVAKMSFYLQPLKIDDTQELRFQFRNGLLGRGNVSIKSFKIKLPSGLSLAKDCEFLEASGNLLNFKKEHIKTANQQLDGEFGETWPYGCDIYISKDATAGAIGDLIKLDPNEGLTARFEYTLSISKVRDIQISREMVSEEKPDATAVKTEEPV